MGNQIISGVRYKSLSNVDSKIWSKISFWKKAEDVELEDGSDAEFRMNKLVENTSTSVTDVSNFDTNYTQWSSDILNAVGEDYMDTYNPSVDEIYGDPYVIFYGAVYDDVKSEVYELNEAFADNFNCLIPETSSTSAVSVDSSTFAVPFNIYIHAIKDDSTLRIENTTQWTYTKVSTDTHGNTAQKIEFTQHYSATNKDLVVDIYLRDDGKVEIVAQYDTEYYYQAKITLTPTVTTNPYTSLSDVQQSGFHDIFSQAAWNGMNKSIFELGMGSRWFATNTEQPYSFMTANKATLVSTGDTSIFDWQKAIDLSDEIMFGNSTLTLGIIGYAADPSAYIKYKDVVYTWDTTEVTIASIGSNNSSEETDATETGYAIKSYLTSISGSGELIDRPYQLLILCNVPTGTDGDIIYASGNNAYHSIYYFPIEHYFEEEEEEEES